MKLTACEVAAKHGHTNIDSCTTLETKVNPNTTDGHDEMMDLRICGVGEDAFFEWINEFGDPLQDIFYELDDDTDDYFCIGMEGRLWILGNHGDTQAAEETAASLGVEVVWMFGRQTAMDWRDSLNQALPSQ
jgi:hypothetical protein